MKTTRYLLSESIYEALRRFPVPLTLTCDLYELADHIAGAIVDTTAVGWFDGVPRPMGVETAEGKR
jgi:hypothetical protein